MSGYDRLCLVLVLNVGSCVGLGLGYVVLYQTMLVMIGFDYATSCYVLLGYIMLCYTR